MIRKIYAAILLLIVTTATLEAHEYRDLLQSRATLDVIKEALLNREQWVPFPNYNDRRGWNSLTGDSRDAIVERGEAAIEYKWEVITATDYLEFDRSGSRDIMQNPFGRNAKNLEALLLAELAEGEGRFIEPLANGVWFMCEMTSWTLSAHVNRAQPERTSLPSPYTDIIDLSSGDIGSLLSWTYYLLKDEFNKVQPLISRRLYDNLQKRILTPFVERDNFWWQATNAKPTYLVNNWNPWCNFNVLATALLIEDDRDRRAEIVYKGMVSVDKFINYTHADGACEEGPSYWGHAAGKMFDYLDLLSRATDGKISIFDNNLIENLGEYIAYSYVGDGWVVNFADAAAKSHGAGNCGIIYRFGEAVDSPIMKEYATYLASSITEYSFHAGRDIYRTLENLKTNRILKERLENSNSKEIKFGDSSSSKWYPDTEFFYKRTDNGTFFAAKGGYNAESHNHNDVGTFSLYQNNTPMIIDIGVGTYTRQTFSSERYSIWTMQSNFHNLPIVNGSPQQFGRDRRSSDIKIKEERGVFALNIANAYPKEAKVETWNRTYKIGRSGRVDIEDSFKLNELISNNQVNFMTWVEPKLTSPGVVELTKDGESTTLRYSKLQFEATVEPIKLTDPKLSKVWGDTVYRLVLKAKKQILSGTYRYSIESSN